MASPLRVEFDEARFQESVHRALLKKKLQCDQLARDTGDQVLAAARQNAPVRTGELRSRIYSEEHADARGLQVSIHSPARYSINVEYGTSNVLPQPFLRPALAEGRQYLRRNA